MYKESIFIKKALLSSQYPFRKGFLQKRPFFYYNELIIDNRESQAEIKSDLKYISRALEKHDF